MKLKVANYHIRNPKVVICDLRNNYIIRKKEIYRN
uniref:Peptidase n=1 Tax=Phage sp. ctv3H3 TaxID=2826753 RepID=A0A8S5NAQ9_9VIRU|nr:MAG TPA: peptidase [Phage sp. ctv3H3]